MNAIQPEDRDPTLPTTEATPVTPHEARAALGRALATTADDLRAWKRWWRTRADERPEPPATTNGLDFLAARDRATLLCLARAHARRRRHARTWCGVDIPDLAAQAQRLRTALAREDQRSRPHLGASERALVRAILEAVGPIPA